MLYLSLDMEPLDGTFLFRFQPDGLYPFFDLPQRPGQG
jgi:hypothetical protein